jgi:hypothetical protein
VEFIDLFLLDVAAYLDRDSILVTWLQQFSEQLNTEKYFFI